MSERPVTTTARLEAFSDGVFAVAITLLVLDLHIPQDPRHGLWRALLAEWPHYATFVVSFLTIGIIWVNHHSQFERIAIVDRTLLFLNLLLLLTVTALPFPTGLLAANLHVGSDKHVAAAVYTGSLMAMGMAFFAMHTWTIRRGLLESWVQADTRRYLMLRNGIGTLAYIAAIAMAFINAPASLVMDGAIAVYFVFPGRA